MEKSSKRNAEIADIIITLVLECGFQQFIDFPYLQTGVRVGKLKISQEKQTQYMCSVWLLMSVQGTE